MLSFVTAESSRTRRLLALLGCGTLVIAWAFVMGRRAEQDNWPAPPAPRWQMPSAQAARPVSEQLPTEAEQRLAGCKLPLYELKISSSDLAAIEGSPFGNTTYPATFTAEGKEYPVKVRARGSWSRSWPKKSFKIQFDHQNPFHGHNSLNLNSAWRDPALVREVLAYKVFAVSGVPASDAKVVQLRVNGHFYGAFIDVEQPDKQFLADRHLKGADLYKAASRSRDADERELPQEDWYRQAYTKETRKTESYEDLVKFCHELARTTDTLAFCNQNLDVDEYINYLAATVLVQNWDGFNKNHYVARDEQGSGKWVVIPWDLDRTFGDHWHMRFNESRLPVLLGTKAMPGVTGWNRLEERFLAEPVLRAKFTNRLGELLDKEFTTAKLFAFLDGLEQEIGPAAELDRMRWPAGTGDLHSGIAGVKSFIEARRDFLQQELQKLR